MGKMALEEWLSPLFVVVYSQQWGRVRSSEWLGSDLWFVGGFFLFGSVHWYFSVFCQGMLGL